MSSTYWYCYDRSGEATGPYFETRGEAVEALAPSEQARPIDEVALPDGAEVVGEAIEASYTAVPDDAVDDDSIAATIDAGECYWCDEYSGDHVGQHASSAHPEAWTAYKNDD